ncbi:MAG: LysR family transcriptional regulator, partial [Yaniella sp.]|uniref:helix-turn-helix domain-containing protein n=2 Tax=Yaniella sp. TaxID=2773929 RepID=UPI00264902F8
HLYVKTPTPPHYSSVDQGLARSLHLSRPALYARVTRLERQLGYSLEDDAEQRTATHLALMAYRVNPDGVYAVLRQRF